jgi:hypothetical protein
MNLKNFLCADSAKAAKAKGYGYLNGILYLAPADLAGVGNLCPHSTAGCRSACLGWHAGRARAVPFGTDLNSVRLSRIRKAQWFMRDRQGFMTTLVTVIRALVRRAERLDLKPCIRLNGSTDIAWEGVRFDLDGRQVNIFEAFPAVQFVDYTKNPNRFSRPLPVNYHLTFSRSETNEHVALKLLAQGVNVAVVFGDGLPSAWRGFRVVDGDKHDLRHLDPRGGFVIGLLPKGKAKRDGSGFVVRTAGASPLPMAA